MHNGRHKPAFVRNLFISTFRIKLYYVEHVGNMFGQNIAEFLSDTQTRSLPKTVIFTFTTTSAPDLTFLAKLYSKT